MLNILVLCTGNSARSILAEALLNNEGSGRVQAYSAGSQPKDTPHPEALALLKRRGIDTEFARSKSWDEFSGGEAPELDVVVTVCDNAAGETCPYFPGAPVRVHWGIPDPAAIEGAEAPAAFEAAEARLLARIRPMLGLPLETLSADDLRSQLVEIGTAAERSET